MKTQRWKRRKDERAPEILEAALACFAEKGFAATRMDDIAARAGITKGTIYLYFESKEAVFKALARQSIGERIAAVTEQLEERRHAGRRPAALCHRHHGPFRLHQRPGGAAAGAAGGGGQFSRTGRILAQGDHRSRPWPVRAHHQARRRARRIPQCRARPCGAAVRGADAGHDPVAHHVRQVRRRALRLSGPDRDPSHDIAARASRRRAGHEKTALRCAALCCLAACERKAGPGLAGLWRRRQRHDLRAAAGLGDRR